MNAVYAIEPRMPSTPESGGVWRRCSENDRRRIELMNGLLLSMPGTPVIYYGDEIGMADNLFLKDRDGVRTPNAMVARPQRGSRARPDSSLRAGRHGSDLRLRSGQRRVQERTPDLAVNWNAPHDRGSPKQRAPSAGER